MCDQRCIFGEESLTIVWWFLQGYEAAFLNNDFVYLKVGPFDWRFNFFVGQKLKDLPVSSRGYHMIILKHCNNDEAKALAKFFELLDDFRQYEKEN